MRCRQVSGVVRLFSTFRKRWQATALQIGLLALPAAAQSVGDGMALLPVDQVRQVAPLFYSVESETKVFVGKGEARSTMQLKVQVHQGRAEKLTVGLSGEGEVVSVQGAELVSWAVRTESDGKRYLDLFPKLPEPVKRQWKPAPKVEWRQSPTVLTPDLVQAGAALVDGPKVFDFTVKSRHEQEERGPVMVLIPSPGEGVGFSTVVRLEAEQGSRAQVVEVKGLTRDEAGTGDPVAVFRGTQAGSMKVQVRSLSGDDAPIELLDPSLVARLADDGKSLSFKLTGKVQAREEGASLVLLKGAGMTGSVSGGNWRVRLAKQGKEWVHELVATQVGPVSAPLELNFDVAVTRVDGWKHASFTLPAGVVVPLKVDGLGKDVSFSGKEPVRAEWVNGAWRGFLNAAGDGRMWWKEGGEVDDGTLFFSSSEIAEVRVGAGLVRQSSTLEFRVLQGKINALKFKIEGEGQVLAVSGEAVVGWQVEEADGENFLSVNLSRPIEGSESLRVQMQSPIGAFPVKAAPMRLIPDGTLRHSGHLRIGNEGAVRLEVVDAEGMMQLSPAQFPGRALEGMRQLFVYRFPSADYRYRVAADQVLPEVSVSEVTIHEMGETDRRILTDLELDVREAPVREWTVGIPDDFAVAEVSGASVADYNVASEGVEGVRELKILFSGAVTGRHLVSLKLERNQAAVTGAWSLPRLSHDGAKSTRGYLGVASAPGYRISTASTAGLAESPVDYFPKKIARLQQAFRIRDQSWTAEMQVEALGQSVQADVFHLYSLKEGVAYGSVVLNYFVVGAPATEWRLSVPEGIGNIDVTGQGVGRDWRREGKELIVPLARPALGASTILVTFEQPMSAHGGKLNPGEVRPLSVQSERGYVHVTSPLQVNATVSRSEGSVLRIDASELPAEYRLLSSAPTLEAWQYTAGDVDLEMGIQWYEAGEAVGEVIDFTSLDSHVARDGQVVTTARLFARSKGASTLQLELPEDANLWEAKVAGERVNARKAGAVTRVPLPRQADPNEAVEVLLRYGQTLEGRKIRLVAPKLGTATAIANWKISGDEGRRLIPEDGGSALLVRPVQTETGFEWLGTYGRVLAPVLLFCAGLGLLLRRVRSLAIFSFVILLGASLWAFALADQAADDRRVSVAVLEYTAPAVLQHSDLFVVISNVEPWKSLMSSGGLLLGVIGLVLLGWAVLRAAGRNSHVYALVVAGVALMVCGVLAQRGGAILFFALFGIALLFGVLIPDVVRFFKSSKTKNTVVTSLMVGLLGWFALSPSAEAGETAESVVQEWKIDEDELQASMTMRVLAEEAGERFPLLSSAAVLTDFKSDGLQVSKLNGSYWVVANREGALTAEVDYRLKIADPGKGWLIPTTRAAVQTIHAQHSEPGWEFQVTNAVRVREGVSKPGLVGSCTEIHLRPGEASKVSLRPKQRDASAEEVRFYTELSDLYVPGPGVVNGSHWVSVRPAQGLVRDLTIKVPEGFTVGEVAQGPVGRWRFNPETRDLNVSIEPAQERPFAFKVATQRAAGALPVEVALSPLRIEGGADSVGMLALAFGGEAQPEAVKAEGMGEVNLDDFPAELLPKNKEGQPLALLQRAYRYGAGEAGVSLRVAPVAPEIRAETKQTLSLGDDRMVLSVDLTTRITRAGVFRLSLEIPETLEVESVTGGALSHWTVTEEEAARVLALNLSGRTLGEQVFSITLTGSAPGSMDSWVVPRVVLRDAARQRGTMTVVPERGLQVRAVSRTHVSQLDPGDVGVPRPGALAFRLLQADWSLALAVQQLDPWVTAQVMHHVTLREGQLMTRAKLVYRIENAARKSLRVRLPGLDERAAATVRASGPAVGDFVPVEGEEGVWEILFQRGVAGETVVDVEYQSQNGDAQVGLPVMELQEVRQLAYYVAIEAGGRLDADITQPVRGWQKIDWIAVPASLRDHQGVEVPDFVFRVAEPEGEIKVEVVRHGLANSEPLRVREGKMVTLLSLDGTSMTSVRLQIDASQKETLSLSLPDEVRPFNLLVNGEGVPLVKDGSRWLFYVAPSPSGRGPAEVAFSYAMQDADVGSLTGPMLDVPLENITWDVFVPQGWQMTRSKGDFQLVSRARASSMSLDDYLAINAQRREKGKAEAVAELDQGYAWLAAGEQDKASKVLGKAARNGYLDEASNEDARVQFRNLKTQQAVLGLNTRRQRNYLDNRYNNDAPNQQLEQAATENPILQGDYNFDPRQFDRLMVGNTTEETSSLKEIANRIVEQQMEIEGAPESLDVELHGQGELLRFTRSLQVEGDQAMTLGLKLQPQQSNGGVLGGLIALLASVVLVIGVRGGKREPVATETA